MIRMVLADDEVILRESLKFILEQDSDIEVVGCVSNGREAYQLCEKHQPDIVLMDLIMPGCDGIEGTCLIKNRFPLIKVIILTTFNDERNLKRALVNGADSFILKTVRPEELVKVIKNTLNDLSVIHQDALQVLVKGISPKNIDDKGIKVNLSEREIKILKMIVEGKSYHEIAVLLYMAEGSVKNNISAMLEKLKLKDRTQLAIYAVRNNLD